MPIAAGDSSLLRIAGLNTHPGDFLPKTTRPIWRSELAMPAPLDAHNLEPGRGRRAMPGKPRSLHAPRALNLGTVLVVVLG